VSCIWVDANRLRWKENSHHRGRRHCHGSYHGSLHPRSAAPQAGAPGGGSAGRASDTVERMSREVDEFVVLDRSPYYLGAVGAYYDSFYQVTDEEVVALLRLAVPEERVKEHDRP